MAYLKKYINKVSEITKMLFKKKLKIHKRFE